MITTLSEFQQLYSNIISQEFFSETEIKKTFEEMNNFINSAKYELLSFDEKEQVQELFDGVHNLFSISEIQESEIQEDIKEISLHDESAENLMDEAEANFYAGRWADAIKLYRKILEIEPTWLRAISHYEQAREYLRTGEIPLVALPPEVAIAYGKAQSAMRVGRYRDAHNLLNNAKNTLAQYGISKWKEGSDFEIILQSLMQAEELVKEATSQFNDGHIDEAIRTIETVYRETNKPHHKDILDKYKYFKSTLQNALSMLLSPNITQFEVFLEVYEIARKLGQDFGSNQALKPLFARIDVIKPLLIDSIRQEIRRLISEAEVAQTIDLALEHVNEANHKLIDASGIGLDVGYFNSVAKEINQLMSEIKGYQKDLDLAEQLLFDKANIKKVKQIITGLHQRFPNDPRVTELITQLRIGFKTPLPAPDDDIDSVIQKAKDLFHKQKIDEAIEYLEYHYKITIAIKLRDIAEEYKEIRRIIADLNEVVYSGSVTEVIEISKLIISMRDKHGDLPIPKSTLEKLNDKLLIYLIDSKNEEKADAASPEQGIAIQGLLSDQSSVSFHDYYRVLNGMILKDPLNQRVQILISWVKHEIDLSEKQSRNRADRNKSIESFRSQAKAWFILSIVAAIVFLALAIYIILFSTQQEDVWVRLSSLFSILPVFISKLVYDQSLTANRRADEMYEKLMDEDARNVELDRLDEKDIRKKVFQEKSKPRQKKTDSNKNTPAS